MIGEKVEMILQQLTLVSDGMGGNNEVFSSKRKIKGAFKTLSGSEQLSGDARTVIGSHRFYCDFQRGVEITEKDRFVRGSRIFNVVLVDNIGELNKSLEIMLKEIE